MGTAEVDAPQIAIRQVTTLDIDAVKVGFPEIFLTEVPT